MWVGAEYAPSDAATGDWGTGAAELTLASSPAIAIGVEGTNGAMYVQAPAALGLSPGWHSEGGAIAAPPAVVAAPNSDGTSPASPLFFATGTNKSLYVRSLTAGWQAVSPHAECVGSPAAVITGTSTLTVACRGTTNALYYNTTTWSGTGLPVFTSGWKSLGGVLTAAPAVAPVGGVLSFFVRGDTGHIYIRTVSSGYAEQQWACLGAPAAALPSPAGATSFACEGTNRELYWSINGGAGWGPTTAQGGVLAAAPAIAASSLVPYFLVEGTTHAIYEHTPTSGFSSLGGGAVGGVGAAALN